MPGAASRYGLAVLFGSGEPAARQRKVRICARVQKASGEKVSFEVPVVMPSSTAQAMGAA